MAGWFSPWLGAVAASPHDSDAVVGPSVAGLDIRQRWRERKGGRRSCGAKSRGTKAGKGGGHLPDGSREGKWGGGVCSATQQKEEGGSDVGTMCARGRRVARRCRLNQHMEGAQGG
jgi:hypothetical protein